MKKVIVSLVISMGITGVAFAGGDAQAGKSKVATCTACHGPTGIGMTPLWPNLAGQGEPYLVKQITDIKEGRRPVPEMAAFVSSLSKQDIDDISAFYASQTAPKGSTPAEYVKLGESLYRGGDSKRQIPACSACHLPGGQGIALARYPQIAGQKVEYTIKQLTDFREGNRNNDDAKIMRTIAQKLSNKEIQALAHYINGLR